jgi:acyl-CoA synthetase (AMP-forming)/AMP-acid ligase II
MPLMSGSPTDAFWNRLERFGDQPCLIEGATGRQLNYRELAQASDQLADGTYGRDSKSLVFIEGQPNLGAVVHLVGALRAGHAVHIYSPALPTHRLEHLKQLYEPDINVAWADVDAGEWGFQAELSHTEQALHPTLGLIFSTSGSTGSSKMVKLSIDNLAASASQIIGALRIDGTARSLLNLPLSYIYGFSVLNSQLSAGGCVILDNRSFIDPRLWADIASSAVDELHGVPTSYDLIQRAWQNGLKLPPLRRITQSGGALSGQTIDWMLRTWASRGVDIYKMYGITEAASRVSVVPPECFEEKCRSVGLVVPGGRLLIGPDTEVIYEGPNVMMGYAFTREGLAHGDDLHGRLITGDCGHLDEDGFLQLHGRRDRTVKVNGLRINLDEAERIFGREGVAVIAQDGGLKVVCTQYGEEDLRKQIRGVMLSIGIPTSLVQIRIVQELPRLGNGKIDYGALSDV